MAFVPAPIFLEDTEPSPTAETEPGAGQLRAAPPASTHDPLTDAQIHAIVVDREFPVGRTPLLTTQNLNNSI
jgi:hypothetical protein